MNPGKQRPATGQASANKPASTGDAAAALYDAALGHLRAGRNLDAQLSCQQVLALNAEHADALHLMGLLYLHGKQPDHAVAWLSRAIAREPRTLYLTTLGTALLQLGRRDEALQAFDAAIQLKPEDAELWCNRALALNELKRPADAIASFQHALKLDPRNFDAANRAALLLHHVGRYEEALVHSNRCDELQPNHFQTLHLRAEALQKLRRFEEALADRQRAHAADPVNADGCVGVANSLASLGRYEEALPWFDRALALRENVAYGLRSKAIALEQLGRFGEAADTHRRAALVNPNEPGSDWNLALLQLLHGDFETGWAGREAARWKIPTLVSLYPKLSRPLWRGAEPIEGKTILLCPDEGLGDVIQFARYVPMLAARGARVILGVQDELFPLLSRLAGVSHCVPRSTGTVPPYDFHCPITSLPFVFATRLDTIPAAPSYLPSPPADRVAAWEARLGPRDRLRVGLCWSGNPQHSNDRNRSLPFHKLAPILDLDATFVSLQKGARPDDMAALRERSGIVDLTTDLTDFAETAALMSCLDLVITVDTSVAHLAGALGRPTWVMLPYAPDYRWLLDREDSPWYPSLRLFRQDARRDYAVVIERVCGELIAEQAAMNARL